MTMEKCWVVVTGGTGMIGQAVCKQLHKRGYAVRVLSRKAREPSADVDDFAVWNPSSRVLPLDAIRGAEAIVHLAGSPIAKRWTASQRTNILESRIQSSQTILEALGKLGPHERPSSIISASAIGWYPNSDETWDESSAAGAGFVSEVVQQWESTIRQASDLGCRTTCLRIGLVLSLKGGVLKSLSPVFSLGLGSPIGNGRHWQSWIHIDDLTRMIRWAIETPSVSGPVNAVSPQPVTNRAFSKAFAKAMHRPFFTPSVPRWILRLIFGEMSSILFASNRIEPGVATACGFEFHHPKIEEAMESLYQA